MIPLHDDNPTTRFPWVTLAVIVLCSLVFLWQISLPTTLQSAVVYGLGFIPAVVFTDAQLAPELYMVPGTLSVFTSMFLHGGFMHLLGNMLFLWVFGNNVEDAMGPLRFLLFFLLCGLAAAAAQALPNPGSEIPMIGASGALSGVLGAYFLLYPRAEILVLIPLGLQVIRIPAALMLGLWLLIQVLSALGGAADAAGVAWLAHIGGFLAGLALVPLFKRARVSLWN